MEIDFHFLWINILNPDSNDDKGGVDQYHTVTIQNQGFSHWRIHKNTLDQWLGKSEITGYSCLKPKFPSQIETENLKRQYTGGEDLTLHTNSSNWNFSNLWP